MTDRNRNQDQQNRGQQQSSPESQQASPRRDEDMIDDETMGTPSRDRSSDRASADDRGLTDRDRRGFSGDREHDELGSEMEDTEAIEDTEDVDEDLGGRSNR
jgi:hypothetical protein